MLNSPSWISKAMLVIFCVITIMGLATRTGSKVKLFHSSFLNVQSFYSLEPLLIFSFVFKFKIAIKN